MRWKRHRDRVKGSERETENRKRYERKERVREQKDPVILNEMKERVKIEVRKSRMILVKAIIC